MMKLWTFNVAAVVVVVLVATVGQVVTADGDAAAAASPGEEIQQLFLREPNDQARQAIENKSQDNLIFLTKWKKNYG
jgi:hypothetical protein